LAEAERRKAELAKARDAAERARLMAAKPPMFAVGDRVYVDHAPNPEAQRVQAVDNSGHFTFCETDFSSLETT